MTRVTQVSAKSVYSLSRRDFTEIHVTLVTLSPFRDLMILGLIDRSRLIGPSLEYLGGGSHVPPVSWYQRQPPASDLSGL